MDETEEPDLTHYPSDDLPELPDDQEQTVPAYDDTIPDEESNTD